MNEIDLIKEVERRPILYDKSVSGFNKTKLRDDAWKEVQDTLNVSEVECKKRWRSLRDSFIKLQRTHGGRTRWPYHHAMRFLLPHIEPSTHEKLTEITKKEEDSDGEEEARRPLQIQSIPDLYLNPDSISLSQSKDDEEDSQPLMKKTRQSSTEEDSFNCRTTDPDELFLLSCAPALKRLSPQKNAVARLKIQQVLYEAEFGKRMEQQVDPSEKNISISLPLIE